MRPKHIINVSVKMAKADRARLVRLARHWRRTLSDTMRIAIENECRRIFGKEKKRGD